MAERRLLVGHTSMVTCCIASRQNPCLVATSAEDGCICCFDMRCKDLIFKIEVGGNPVTSVCFKTGDESIIYASCGTMLRSYDVRQAGSWKPLESYDHNKDEINQVVCNSRSSFVASADDGGEVKIIDIQQQRLYKTLKHCHTSICSTVQFVPWRPWQVITGGLDSKLVVWDFSKGRPNHILDLATGGGGSDTCEGGCDDGKMWNPAFVHSVTVPDVEMSKRTGRVCGVGRGDGDVDVVNIDRLCEKQTVGSHNCAVSCVAFSEFGDRGKFMISGSNDRHVKVWDLGCSDGHIGRQQRLVTDIRLSRKVNWLCTTISDSDNLVVCDTSNTTKVYTLF